MFNYFRTHPAADASLEVERKANQHDNVVPPDDARSPLDVEMEKRKATVKEEDIEAVRGALQAKGGAHVEPGDDLIHMYLRATTNNIAHAARRLEDTLKWRAHERPERLICRTCLQQPRSHYLHPVGFDRGGRPVIYSVLTMPTNRSPEDNRAHMIACFEQAIRLMPPGVEQWIWVSDFHGFGLADCDPRIAHIFLELSARYYPERLARFLVVDPPRLFSGLWHMLQPVIDPHTKQKVVFLPYDVHLKSGKGSSSLATELGKLMDADTAHWLLTEMAQNRDKKMVSNKVYPYGKVHEHVPEDPSVHDVRGTPKVIDAIKKDPSIILPEQADAPSIQAAT